MLRDRTKPLEPQLVGAPVAEDGGAQGDAQDADVQLEAQRDERADSVERQYCPKCAGRPKKGHTCALRKIPQAQPKAGEAAQGKRGQDGRLPGMSEVVITLAGCARWRALRNQASGAAPPVEEACAAAGTVSTETQQVSAPIAEGDTPEDVPARQLRKRPAAAPLLKTTK